MAVDGLVSTEAAARLLGVSSRRVNQLAATGEIIKAARGLYDRLSIERHLVARQGSGRRAWDAATAWGAVALLSGRRTSPTWLPQRSVYRLAANLRAMEPVDLVSRTRHRATVHVYSGHPSVARILRDTVVARDWNIVGLADQTGDEVDGYLAADELAAVVDRFALTESTSGNVTLRVTGFDMAVVRSLSRASDALVALDAAGVVDPRARGAGERVLERALARFRDLG